MKTFIPSVRRRPPACRGGTAFIPSAALLLCLSLSLPQPGRGAQVEGLYEAAVPVAGQSVEVRGEVLGRILAAVLVKVTGDASVAARPEAAALLKQAPTLVLEERYEQAPVVAGSSGSGAPPEPASDTDTAQPEPGLLMWARFDPVALREGLNQAGLPVWGRERPTVIYWVAVNGDGERLLSDADTGPVATALRARSVERGLPVVLPLMDLEDTQAVAASDISGGFVQRLANASRRYGAAVAVGAVLRPSGDRTRVTWQLVMSQGGGSPGDLSGADPARASAAMVDAVADALAARYARAGSPGGGSEAGLRIFVTDVQAFPDYARLQTYLRQLSAVSSVKPLGLEEGYVSFELSVAGGREEFDKLIELGNVLRPAPAQGGEGAWYRLQP